MLLTPLMLDIQHIIGLEQYVELYDPLPLALMRKMKIIIIYYVISKLYLLRLQISDSAESLSCRVHYLHVKIIKQIQTSNEQYKFRANLHKYHDVLNVRDYFTIQIKTKQCSLETNLKF
jgi:hypothetical protein